MRTLLAGTRQAPPPAPGCGRAGRCPSGLDEADLTWWAAGGTGLLPGVSVDTHFSERARELRLVALLAASDTSVGMGADEASALRVQGGSDWHRVEAIGEAGGWVFVAAEGGPSGLGTDAFYLGDGTALSRKADGPVLEGDGLSECLARDVLPAMSAEQSDDALADGALRSVARRLAACGASASSLPAANGTVRVQRDARTRVSVRGEHIGIGPLRLEWRPDEAR
ncbi:hypothetical protein [Alkalisalibacterium limincola]|uniref:Uncharacterized protein n=1 Tax=Alkalisalibacterium limincola TaxID=2699169 RepID=A0A5C8KQP1_9GAMM|nr:hypothetical protein [Alkalisalibacterium limincola]TXK62315.1 hypothetical protein FU658_08760 [Alkalisalibacterium limincola]